MPRSKMPDLSPMEIEQPDADGYLKQSEYLKKPEKPNALKQLKKKGIPVEKSIESVEPVEDIAEPVEKPVKKKRVMSEKQLASLARARAVSAQKRKEKKALKMAEEKPLINKKVKPVNPMKSIPEESSSDDEPSPQQQLKKSYGSLQPPDSVEERVYQRIMKEKADRRAVKEQQREDARLAREYEESIREDERKKLYEMTQRVEPKKQRVNAKAMLQPNKWEECFAPKKRNPFGF